MVWKLDVPGRSWSSPVVWGDHVFVTTVVNVDDPVQPLKPVPEYRGRSWNGPLDETSIATTADAHRWMLYDVDFRSGTHPLGARRCTRLFPLSPSTRRTRTSPRRPSPTASACTCTPAVIGLFAFDMSGKPVWSKPMPRGEDAHGLGRRCLAGAAQGRLYIVNDNEEQSYLAAYDAPQRPRAVARRIATSTPTTARRFVWENELRTEIVTTGTGRVRSYDLNGRPLWDIPRMSVLTVPTPLARHGLLFVSAGYIQDPHKPVYAIRPGAAGDISLEAGETQQPIHRVEQHADQLLSAVTDRRRRLLLHAAGSRVPHLPRREDRERDLRTSAHLGGVERVFSASPWSYNGRIFALSEDGDTFVIQAGPEFKILGKNSLDEMSMATPAVANGSLIMRTANTLYRFMQR